MQRASRISVILGTVIGMLLIGVTPVHAQSGEKPKASDVGVTPTEIHVATVADVDNPFAPGVFQGAVAGAKGAAAYLNSKAGGGGVAGRKIVVDFIDSKLSATESRNAVISACQDDFAMVGSAVVFLTSVDDGVNCKDQAGAATGLPDMASFTTGVAQSCSPVSFPLNPPQLVCSTKFDSPQTYNSANGASKYLLKKYGKLHGAELYSTDTKDATRSSRVLTDSATAAGIKPDVSMGVSALSPQSAYTPIINKMKSEGSNYGESWAGENSMILLRSEAQLQGLSNDIVWYCGCYSKTSGSNPAMEGSHTILQFLPFEEASSNAMLKNFVKYVPRDKADSFAVFSWSAMLAFADAAKAVVAKDGVNGLTRKALLTDGIPTLTKFDAGGMIGKVNIPAKIPSPCFMLMQIKNKKYVREYPKKKGTLDCSPKNKIEIKADYIGG